MRIYPAIDIKDGKCVRLTQGSFSDVTVYGDEPVEIAKQWEECGAEFLHTVDLDGAQKGSGINRKIIIKIAQALKIPVQTGGGIRTIEDIRELIDGGVSRVILGTVAVKNPELVEEAVKEFGDKIAVGIDAKDGFVAISGWEEVSSVSALNLAEQMCKKGVKTIIYTDIATDGMLSGPNITAMKQMADSVSADIIASGGVGSTDDILSLISTGVEGVIVGKALYAGKVDLKDAINRLASTGGEKC
ncbi:MAG: 1-(5-phosphoribosyl)-5-[Clostridia bacterium]|nr:1-(5-phosphoribosyl)-5-[(5-phosphoribosylamino)methylideneamino]imidazole-4-carboxamide isomerase [Clostridia bacterium]